LYVASKNFDEALTYIDKAIKLSRNNVILSTFKVRDLYQ